LPAHTATFKCQGQHKHSSSNPPSFLFRFYFSPTPGWKERESESESEREGGREGGRERGRERERERERDRETDRIVLFFGLRRFV